MCPTIDELYLNYIEKLKEGDTTSFEPVEAKKEKILNPFAVFEHPNFSKIYGKALNKEKPIFILGGKMTEDSKLEYKELYDNTSRCFSNPIYYPFNTNVSGTFNDSSSNIYLNSLLVIVNGNDYNESLAHKIQMASSMNITVLILVKEDSLKELFQNKFGLNDTVLIKKYTYNDKKSQKEFADIMVGLYINEYKKIKVAQ